MAGAIRNCVNFLVRILHLQTGVQWRDIVALASYNPELSLWVFEYCLNLDHPTVEDFRGAWVSWYNLLLYMAASQLPLHEQLGTFAK